MNETLNTGITWKELKEIFEKNSIPNDTEIRADAGDECNDVPIRTGYYSSRQNIIMLTSGDYGYGYIDDMCYLNPAEWKMLFNFDRKELEWF